jgi:putative copper export protein
MIEYFIICLSYGIATYICMFMKAWKEVYKESITWRQIIGTSLGWVGLSVILAPILTLVYIINGHDSYYDGVLSSLKTTKKDDK